MSKSKPIGFGNIEEIALRNKRAAQYARRRLKEEGLKYTPLRGEYLYQEYLRKERIRKRKDKEGKPKKEFKPKKLKNVRKRDVAKAKKGDRARPLANSPGTSGLMINLPDEGEQMKQYFIDLIDYIGNKAESAMLVARPSHRQRIADTAAELQRRITEIIFDMERGKAVHQFLKKDNNMQSLQQAIDRFFLIYDGSTESATYAEILFYLSDGKPTALVYEEEEGVEDYE